MRSATEPCAWCGGEGAVDPVANFLLARLRDRPSHASYQWIGSSSDAMVIAAMTGGEPTDRPFDGWDLGRCMVTRALAPESLHERMDAILTGWVGAMEREKAETGHPYHDVESARGMLAKYEQVVRVRIGVPDA